MTLEELKAEAKKHGYKLVKEQPYIRMSPCVCGHKRISLYFTLDNNSKTVHFYRCYKCGLESDRAKTKYQAKLKWNECVENAKKEEIK